MDEDDDDDAKRPPRPSKKDLLLALLQESQALLQLDGRAAGVELPDWLRDDPAVVLQIGYQMPVPIPDLAVDDDGVTATLSFRRAPFLCRLPWRAIYVMSDGARRQAVFPEDIPPDLAEAKARAEKAAPPPQQPQQPPAKRPRPSHLKLVK